MTSQDPEKVIVELTRAQADALRAVLGWALDEDHAAFEPDWLDSRIGADEGTAELIQSACERIAAGQKGGLKR